MSIIGNLLTIGNLERKIIVYAPTGTIVRATQGSLTSNGTEISTGIYQMQVASDGQWTVTGAKSNWTSSATVTVSPGTTIVRFTYMDLTFTISGSPLSGYSAHGARYVLRVDLDPSIYTVSNPSYSWTTCLNAETGSFTLSETALVRYGANPYWTYHYLTARTVTQSTANAQPFPDCYGGTVKHFERCYASAISLTVTPSTSGYTKTFVSGAQT